MSSTGRAVLRPISSLIAAVVEELEALRAVKRDGEGLRLTKRMHRLMADSQMLDAA